MAFPGWRGPGQREAGANPMEGLLMGVDAGTQPWVEFEETLSQEPSQCRSQRQQEAR